MCAFALCRANVCVCCDIIVNYWSKYGSRRHVLVNENKRFINTNTPVIVLVFSFYTPFNYICRCTHVQSAQHKGRSSERYRQRRTRSEWLHETAERDNFVTRYSSCTFFCFYSFWFSPWLNSSYDISISSYTAHIVNVNHRKCRLMSMWLYACSWCLYIQQEIR